MAEPVVPVVSRLRVRNFASIADCEITFGPLTVLVGFNATGKSNLLDALRFLIEALAFSPFRALSSRGGLDRILHRTPSGGSAESFTIEVDLQLGSDPDAAGGEPLTARYRVEIGRDRVGPVPVAMVNDTCEWIGPGATEPQSRDPNHAYSGLERLILPALAASGEKYRKLEDALASLRFYELNSAALRRIDDSAERYRQLGPQGEHLGHVLGWLAVERPEAKEQLDSYLRAVVPQALGVDERREGDFSTVQARFWGGENGLPYWQAVATGAVYAGDPQVEVFQRQELSEGTVKAAGVLAALFQPAVLDGTIGLVAIEEPESAIHPSSVGALYDAAYDASRRTQVVITTQSADFLDSDHADASHLVVVEMVKGATQAGAIDDHTRQFVADQRYRLADLHRQGQLRTVKLDETPGIREDQP